MLWLSLGWYQRLHNELPSKYFVTYKVNQLSEIVNQHPLIYFMDDWKWSHRVFTELCYICQTAQCPHQNLPLKKISSRPCKRISTFSLLQDKLWFFKVCNSHWKIRWKNLKEIIAVLSDLLGSDFVFQIFSKSSQIFSHYLEKLTQKWLHGAKRWAICRTSILEW